MDSECKKAQQQKNWLNARGIVPEKNEELRKIQIRDVLIREEK